MLPGLLAAAAVYGALYPWRKGRLSARGLRSTSLREGAMLLFWMFCGGLALLTLTPQWFSLLTFLSEPGAPWPPFFAAGSVNLVPLRTFGLEPWRFFILLGNIVMFVPFGFCAALLWRGARWPGALVLGALITLGIECWQLLVGRAFDVDDLLLNTFGVLCGYWLWLALRRLFPAFAPLFQVEQR